MSLCYFILSELAVLLSKPPPDLQIRTHVLWEGFKNRQHSSLRRGYQDYMRSEYAVANYIQSFEEIYLSLPFSIGLPCGHVRLWDFPLFLLYSLLRPDS
jgi:hypothetical protein